MTANWTAIHSLGRAAAGHVQLEQQLLVAPQLLHAVLAHGH